jgi:cytochrome oxidase Cu insertion factor (SCO1/SenC/PrrC family)
MTATPNSTPDSDAMTRLRAALVALVVVLTGCAEPADPIQRAAGRMTGSAFMTPYDMPAVTLTDQNGEDFDLRLDTREQMTLVFFGYTSCPDICPITMAKVARAVGLLEPEVREHVGVLFVSLDAKRDTPERVKEWLGTFDRGRGVVPPDVRRERHGAHDTRGLHRRPGRLDRVTLAGRTARHARDTDVMA